jgi:hypothetical protein
MKKGTLVLNNITQKYGIISESGKTFPLEDCYQGWHWLFEGQEVDYHLKMKYSYDNSKCKCQDKTWEDAITCKHFVGGGINDCMQVESTMSQVAALEWPTMSIEESKNVDSFILAFHNYMTKYPDDESTPEEILKEFKQRNGLIKPGIRGPF